MTVQSNKQHEPVEQTTGMPSPFLSRAPARVALAMSWVLVPLIAASAAAGLWVTELYRDPTVVVATTRGTDLIGLVVVAPVLAWSAWAVSRGNAVATLTWLSTLAYCVYVYAFAVFGMAFNDAFLAHIAIFSLAVYGLAFALVAVDAHALADRFASSTPVRFVAALLLVLAATMVGMWSWNTIGWSLTGTLPTEAFPMPLDRVHLGYVMDAGILAPACAISGLLLWRRRPWGYVLGTVVMSATALVQIAYLSIQAFISVAGIPDVPPVDVAYLPFIVVMVGAAALMLASARIRVEPT